jgi:hypothetical protein
MSLIIYLRFFIRATPCKKSKGLSIDVSYHLSYDFYTCSVAYIKQGALD